MPKPNHKTDYEIACEEYQKAYEAWGKALEKKRLEQAPVDPYRRHWVISESGRFEQTTATTPMPDNFLFQRNEASFKAIKPAFVDLQNQHDDNKTTAAEKIKITNAIKDLTRDCRVGELLLDYRKNVDAICQPWSQSALKRAQETAKWNNRVHDFYHTYLPCFAIAGITLFGTGLIVGAGFGLTAMGTMKAAAAGLKAAGVITGQAAQSFAAMSKPAWSAVEAGAVAGYQTAAPYGALAYNTVKPYAVTGYQAAASYATTGYNTVAPAVVNSANSVASGAISTYNTAAPGVISAAKTTGTFAANTYQATAAVVGPTANAVAGQSTGALVDEGVAATGLLGAGYYCSKKRKQGDQAEQSYTKISKL